MEQGQHIELSLVPTHPDGAGGLGFLSHIVYAFTPLLLAQGALYAGTIANRIFFLGAKLPEFEIDLALVVAVPLFAVLGPSLVFIPQLGQSKRMGLREYGVLAQRLVREFDHKWLRGGAADAAGQNGGPAPGSRPITPGPKSYIQSLPSGVNSRSNM
jgi:hypothetical protein